MKKILLLIIPFLYLSCDKIPSGTVDYSSDGNIAVDINAPEVVVFNEADSTITINLKKYGAAEISDVWVDIYSPNEDLIDEKLYLLDDGELDNGDTTLNDNVYSAKFSLSRYNLNGKYTIEYYVKFADGNTWKAGYHSFTYYNGQQNYPPIISDLVAPDTLTTGVDKTFTFSVKAWDPNGSGDIKRVYFQSFRPNGTSNGYLYDMTDDGTIGDEVAGDGIYTFSTEFPSSATKGLWTYVFTSIDWSDSASNTITHKIYVK